MSKVHARVLGLRVLRLETPLEILVIQLKVSCKIKAREEGCWQTTLIFLIRIIGNLSFGFESG